jgi:hypothetical protein
VADLTDALNQLLDDQADAVGRRIGTDPDHAKAAIHAAVPALLAAFGQEAERGGGIRQAIRQDHDGAILDQLSDYLGGTAQLDARTTNGAGILDHVLGDRQQEVATALSAKSGLDLGTIMQLLPLLAPIVMGMLGKKSNASPGGGFDLDDLGSILGRERADNRSRNPDIGDILDSLGGGGSRSSKGGVGDVLDSMLGGDRS